ncbi:MAG TPA: NUDIX hydrolase [Polyangiaceae bacterium]|nr:NUDIX hydrolase [Polyangiaceae bacterium]
MKYRPLAPWQVLERRTLVERRWLSVHQDRIRLGNGREIAEFHLIEAPHWASVVCLSEKGELVLVRQYRHGLGGESLELPAGVIDPGEEPLAAARRELGEETGYAAARWEPLVSLSPEPSRHTARAHFFCALGATASVERALDESEDIDVVPVPCAEVLGLIDGGTIVHAAHVGAILLAAQRGFITL